VDPVAALEIGTTKVVAMVGEKRDDGTVMITGVGECQSVGVRKGEIIDLDNAMSRVKLALDAAEDMSNVYLRQVYLCVSGGHICGMTNRGSTPILDADKVISDYDIDQVIDIARAVSIPSDRQIIHTIHRYFSIDDQEKIISPEGMCGSMLFLDMLVLHGVRSLLVNSSRVVEQLQTEVNDTAFSGLCSALAVLTSEQKKSGAVVIDLGGGTTDYMAYTDGVAACGGSLGVGGDHITNDIALAFKIPVHRAEKLKKESGSAILSAVTEPAKVYLPEEVGFPNSTINVRSMHTVINARVKEIFEMVKKRLDDENVLPMIGTGIVLSGGGAHLKGVTELAEKVFGVPCFVGKPRGIAGLTSAVDGPEYAACCGLVQYGLKVQGDQSDKGSILGSLMKNLWGAR
jgi:cell division protein FtsA